MNTMTESKTTRRAPSPSDVVASIEAAALPSASGETIRSLSTPEQAAKIRGLLKSLGIKGVSAKRSHAGWSATVAVSFTALAHADGGRPNWSTHNRIECVTCSRNHAAQTKVEAIILAAFPDCGDRSDLMTDYFDYVFTVRSEEV